MTRFLFAVYLACLFFAAQPGPQADACAVFGPLPGFLALMLTLRRLTLKGSPHHDEH